jgi:hypothetical protein
MDVLARTCPKFIFSSFFDHLSPRMAYSVSPEVDSTLAKHGENRRKTWGYKAYGEISFAAHLN